MEKSGEHLTGVFRVSEAGRRKIRNSENLKILRGGGEELSLTPSLKDPKDKQAYEQLCRLYKQNVTTSTFVALSLSRCRGVAVAAPRQPVTQHRRAQPRQAPRRRHRRRRSRHVAQPYEPLRPPAAALLALPSRRRRSQQRGGHARALDIVAGAGERERPRGLRQRRVASQQRRQPRRRPPPQRRALQEVGGAPQREEVAPRVERRSVNCVSVRKLDDEAHDVQLPAPLAAAGLVSSRQTIRHGLVQAGARAERGGENRGRPLQWERLDVQLVACASKRVSGWKKTEKAAPRENVPPISRIEESRRATPTSSRVSRGAAASLRVRLRSSAAAALGSSSSRRASSSEDSRASASNDLTSAVACQFGSQCGERKRGGGEAGSHPRAALTSASENTSSASPARSGAKNRLERGAAAAAPAAGGAGGSSASARHASDSAAGSARWGTGHDKASMSARADAESNTSVLCAAVKPSPGP